MNTPSVARRVGAGTAALAVLAAAACSGSSKHNSSTTPTTPAPPTHSSSAAPRPAPKNPFTGIGAVPKHPVIAVKIDDTAAGRPQRGIDRADVVYVEAVEGGLTRLAAVFATSMTDVGYVRSTRPSDPDLLLQYGKITEAYSGGAHDSLPRVHSSGITSWSMDAGAAYYSRRSHAGDHGYINVVLDLAKVAAKTKTTRPRSNGWTFAAGLTGLPAKPGTRVDTVVRGSNAGGTAVQFRYDAKLRKYVRYIDGVRQHAADGNVVTTTNVIVQQCVVKAHPADTDVVGNASQFTYTTGSGRVTVFRQGKRIEGTWSRKSLSAGTTLRLANGRSLPLAPGNSWVVLATRGTPVRS